MYNSFVFYLPNITESLVHPVLMPINSQSKKDKALTLLEPEVSSVEDSAGNLGTVPQPVQPFKKKHHRPGTMICRDSSHLKHQFIAKKMPLIR